MAAATAASVPEWPKTREVVVPVVGGIDIHRAQSTFDYVDLDSGEVVRGRLAPADRERLRRWLARFAGRDAVAFALEGCTGWRYVAEELARAGIAVHVAEPAETAARRGPKRRAKTAATPSCCVSCCLRGGSRSRESRRPRCWRRVRW